MIEEERDEYTLSMDKGRLDLDVIHQFLSVSSYWARNIPRETVERAIRNSLCFGIYRGNEQVGFARVVTDFAVFAYVGDVFVLESHRGRGLSRWLMKTIRQHPDLTSLRRWHLLTDDAHGLYRQVGFTALKSPERHMEISVPNPYGA